MDGVLIRLLNKGEAIPYELLLEADPSRKLIDNYLGKSEIFVAVLNENIIGTYVLCPIATDVVEVKNISVDESHQNKGLGTLMLKDAFQQAKERQFKTIIIGTGNSSVGQLYLYQKVGFEITGIRSNFFVDNYPELLYENDIQVKHMIVLSKKLE